MSKHSLTQIYYQLLFPARRAKEKLLLNDLNYVKEPIGYYSRSANTGDCLPDAIKAVITPLL